ncbi:hypothetical protein GCM10009746_00300 [Microbacterium paludicola]
MPLCRSTSPGTAGMPDGQATPPHSRRGRTRRLSDARTPRTTKAGRIQKDPPRFDSVGETLTS